jgi:hypothetical protein
MTDPDAQPPLSPPEPPDVIPGKGTLLKDIVKFLLYCVVFCFGAATLFQIIHPFLPSPKRVVAMNGATCSALNALGRALEAYREDFGTYPVLPDKPLVADTRQFIQCLQSKGKRGPCYYDFLPADLVDGEYRSPHGRPYSYTFPAAGIPGPDGKVHPNVKYYLWTWGGIGKGPEAAWEINNWDGR